MVRIGADSEGTWNNLTGDPGHNHGVWAHSSHLVNSFWKHSVEQTGLYSQDLDDNMIYVVERSF